ncbi:putative transcription factor MYB-HB-like family [Helianthus debilis subsp. tardiflorus]
MNKASSKEAGEVLDEPMLEGDVEERGKVKGSWSPEEDTIFSDLVSKFGAKNWSLIARGIPGRTGKSCCLRWCNQLDPAVMRKPFTGNR